jgi:hypothetical protein
LLLRIRPRRKETCRVLDHLRQRRVAWGQGEFPFLYVQKPSGGGCAWDKSNPTTRVAEDFTALPAAPQQAGAGSYRAHHVRIAVQYAWGKNAPWANLFNKDGLPALIFRAGE